MYFKEYIKSIRAQKDMTQLELANELGITVDTIKKIESGVTQVPSSKVLKALAQFVDKNEVEVMQVILFGVINDDVDPRTKRIGEHSFKYLAYMYIHGWNILESFNNLYVHDIGEYQFIGEIAKKRDSNYLVLVDHIDKYNLDEQYINDRNYQISIFSNFFVTLISINKDFKAMHVLFDANDKKESKLYNSLKSFSTDKTKLSIYYILFDGIKCEVIEEHKVC